MKVLFLILETIIYSISILAGYSYFADLRTSWRELIPLLSYLNFVNLITKSFFYRNLLKPGEYEFAKNISLRSFILNIILVTILFNVHDYIIVLKVATVSGILMLLLFEQIFLIIYYWKSFSKIFKYSISLKSFYIFFFDLLILIASIYLRYIKKINELDISIIILSSIVILSWLTAGFLYTHFNSKIDTLFWRYIWPFIKSYILIFIINIFFAVVLEVDVIIFYKLITTLLFYSFASFLFFSIRFFIYIPPKSDLNTIKFNRAIEIDDSFLHNSVLFKGSKYELNGRENIFTSVRDKLKEIYLKNFKNVFNYIDNRINLDSINIEKSLVLRSSDIYNIQTLPDNTLELVMNLHPFNDFRRINAYFIEVNKKLINSGVFICCLQTTYQRYNSILKKYPYFLALIVNLLDFIFNRVFPKLPILQQIYFSITKGKNRAVSLAEGLGRLVYCGFNIIDFKEIGNLTYIICFKSKEPLVDSNPSYGPFFKMRRIGKDGKEIYVYKFRTMHPYSEYIQSLVYEMFNIKEGGKIKNDFRITVWGKILRKLWIDELPMLINFLKGELKLVGVRPLSKHYLSLYPEELKELRKKVKPGLIPPFYYDLPKTLDEIFESEYRYISAYLQAPLKTDLKYFVRAVYNIVFKNARSG